MGTNPASKTYIDALILDAETRQALLTVRSLGRKGLRIAAIANAGKIAPSCASRWCIQAISSPVPEGTAAYTSFLIAYLKKNRVGIIIPSADGTIAALRKQRGAISQLTTIALADEESLAVAVNKNKTIAVAEKLGIKVPKSITITKEEQLEKAVSLLKLPVVLKPSESWTEDERGVKRVSPILASTQEKARSAFEDLTEFGGNVIIQEYIPGTQEAVSFIYAKKKVFARFAQWAKRTQPPLGGTSVLRQSIAVPMDTGEQAERLIRELDLKGYSEVEFRRSKNGEAYLMEINPRLSMSVDIAIQSGIDFPYLLYQWARGEKIHYNTAYKTGLWERYLAGDLVALAESLQQTDTNGFLARIKTVLEFTRSTFQPMKYDYIDWSDMKPVWIASGDFLLRNIKKLSHFVPSPFRRRTG